jgi:phosphoribosylanthranilate isomerase
MITRIKICGITNIEDALAAYELGADALGFVFADSPRQVTEEQAGSIVNALPPLVTTVGVFTESDEKILGIAAWVGLDLIQLHGDQNEQFAEQIRSSRVIRAARIRDEDSLEKLTRWKHGAAYLLDTWTGGQMGGTGTAFNWKLAIKAKEYGKPIILAGGLTPDNIKDAIISIRPFAIDVSSGVESRPGKKDYSKMKEFIANVRAADQIA